jgi:tRNA 2-thiouridine synthesizing protein A
MTSTEIAHRVDARGLSCPLPIVRTALAVKDLPSGSLVEVLATDPGSVKDFTAWARTTGHRLLHTSGADGVYRFVLVRK